MIKARASGSKVYLYFMKKGRQARHRIPRNSCFFLGVGGGGGGGGGWGGGGERDRAKIKNSGSFLATPPGKIMPL